MSNVFIATCLQSGCWWSHCDFLSKDESNVLEGAKLHHYETEHTISVVKNIGNTAFIKIKTFEKG